MDLGEALRGFAVAVDLQHGFRGVEPHRPKLRGPEFFSDDVVGAQSRKHIHQGVQLLRLDGISARHPAAVFACDAHGDGLLR